MCANFFATSVRNCSEFSDLLILLHNRFLRQGVLFRRLVLYSLKNRLKFLSNSGHYFICTVIVSTHVVLLACRSMSEALMLRAFRVDHLSVRTCEQWPHTWMDFYAV